MKQLSVYSTFADILSNTSTLLPVTTVVPLANILFEGYIWDIRNNIKEQYETDTTIE